MVGGGSRFLSGISYYTHRLVCELDQRYSMSAIVARQLVPTRLYPGGARVGKALTKFEYPDTVEVVDGLDWYWGPNILRVIGLIYRQRPHVVVLQWWTGALLHSYLLVAAVARLRGAKVVIEFHEVQDVGEAAIPLLGAYVDAAMPLLVRMTDAAVIHSEVDRSPVTSRHRLGSRPVSVIPHGPYDQHSSQPQRHQANENRTDDGSISLLYFGVIRPFKGVEDLIRAFDLLNDEEVRRFTLTIVGETWENWTLPKELVTDSRFAERITFINRYVDDDEVSTIFSAADAVVLPYHRSSASGPLHIAMSAGLPVIVTEVGGLVEAAGNYEGTVFVPPKNPEAIRDAILTLTSRPNARYADPHSWERTVDGFTELFGRMGLETSGEETSAKADDEGTPG